MNVLFVCRGAELLGVEYLSSFLKRAGHRTELLFDPALEDNLYFKNPFAREFRLNDKTMKRIERFNPDLIAASALTGTYLKVRKLSMELKRRFGVPALIGGVHATALPEMALNDGFDMVCRGEGEEALLELVTKLEAGKGPGNTRNIWFKKGGKIVRNGLRPLIQDLDSLPMPDKDMFFRCGAFTDTLYVMTGRGCPFKCTYCFNHFYQKIYCGLGNYVRRRSVENVIEEIKLSQKKHNVRFVEFLDDTFTLDRGWVEKFCAEYGESVGIPFRILTHPATVNKKILTQLKLAGCRDIAIGVESGDSKIRRKVLGRDTTNEQILKAGASVKNAGINLQLFVMFGVPDETPEDMWKTVELVRRIRPKKVGASVFYPFPNTKLMEYARERGLINAAASSENEAGGTGSNNQGSYYYESVINHPHRMDAENLKNLVPISNAFPFLHPLVKRVYRKDLGRAGEALGLVYVPFRNPDRAARKLGEYVNMWIASRR